MADTTVGWRMMREFYWVLSHKAINTIYQPVVPISGSKAIGYEALSRGTVPDLASPITLFSLAIQHGMATQLDQLCCRRAIQNFPLAHRLDALLFINLRPETIESGAITAEILSEWVASASLSPSRIVLEVTEQQMTDPIRFYRQVSRMRERGFRFAVDDVGTGFSNFSLLSDLVPEFFKLDLEFVHLTRIRPVRQLLVETLVRFAGQIGAMVVAEGIESSEDAEVFRLLGVHLAQGYLYRPA